MSFFRKYLKGWQFRSTTPTFRRGEEIYVFVGGYEDGHAVARVGDTRIRIPDAPPGLQDMRVHLRITDFDGSEHVGEAEYVETVGESAF